MKKLIVSGWTNFIILFSNDTIQNNTKLIKSVLINNEAFKKALVETEIIDIHFDQDDLSILLSGEEIEWKGDNGNIKFEVKHVIEGEIFHQ